MSDLFQYADTRPRYPHSAGYRDNAASRDAAEAIAPRLEYLEQQVLYAAERAGERGVCAFELPDLCQPHSFAALQPRLTSLTAKGDLVKTSERRTNPETGRSASVWKRRGF